MSRPIKLIHYHDRRYITRDAICAYCGTVTAYVSLGIILCEQCGSEYVVDANGTPFKTNDFLYQP